MIGFKSSRLPWVLGCALAAASALAAAENIVQSSEVSPSRSGKVEAVLMVGTSGLNTDSALGNKQALIGAEVRKLLKAAGIQVHPIAIKPQDADPSAVIAEAVAKNKPTHVMSITVPRGEVYVDRRTKESSTAKTYVVRAEIVDAKTNAAVWKYSAEVTATFGASNAEVAQSIVARMRADDIL